MNSKAPPVTDFGFGTLDDLSDDELDGSDTALAERPAPPKDEVKAVAERNGYKSREPAETPRRREPPAPVTKAYSSVTIRVDAEIADRFYALRDSQEPKWPSGYMFKKMLEALEDKMAADQK